MADFSEAANAVVSQLSKANVDMIFGESRQFGDKVVIPVGKLKYGWGGGSGEQESKAEEAAGKKENEGMGMGMGMMVKPMGYITVTADRVTYEPIMDFGPVMLIIGPVLALAVLKLFGAMGMMMKSQWGHMGYYGPKKWAHMKHEGPMHFKKKFMKHGMRRAA